VRHEHVRREAQLNCCRHRGAADSHSDGGVNYHQSAELGATVFRYSINIILHEAMVPTGAVEEVLWEQSRSRMPLSFRNKLELTNEIWPVCSPFQKIHEATRLVSHGAS